MSKAELVDLIYLNITGGKPSPDLNIQRVDIAALLPLILADAIKVFQQETRREQIEEIRLFGYSSSENVNSQFVRTFSVTPVYDEDTELYTVLLPKKVAILPFDRGINSLRPKIGPSYIRVRSFDEVVGIDGYVNSYWHKNIDNVQKIYISNIGLPVCEHYLEIVVDFSDLDDDDDTYLPAGMNMYMLNQARQYLLGERQFPVDNVHDYKTDNK